MTQPTDKRFVMENRLDAEIAQVNDALDAKVDLTDPRLTDERVPVDNSVTSAKIANGAIVDEDVNASAAIAKTKIAGTAVTQADTGTVTSTMIANGTVTGTDIASDTVTEANLAALDYVKFDTTYAGGSTQPGMLAWDQANETLQFQLDPHVTLQVGQEHVMRVKNASGTVAIPERTVVMFAGATGDTIKVSPAVSDGSVNVNYLAGITTEEIPADGFGFVTQLGFINQTNTNGWAVGTILYADPAVAGGLTPTEPELPAWTMPVAAVTKQSLTAGRMLVRAIPGGSGAGGSSVVISDTVPAGGTKGDLWLDSTEGTLYIYFEDADSSQWVQVKANSALEGSILERLGAVESTQAAALQSTTAVTNLVTNPSFETNASLWFTSGSATLSRVTTEFYTGSASLEIVASASGGGASTDTLTGLSASTTYTASLWVKGEAGKLIDLRLIERTAADAYVGESYSGNITATGSWQRITVTRTFGATGASARVQVFNRTSGAHKFYVDAVQLEVGSTATDYFDGYTAAAGGYVYGWTGAPHASSSIKRWDGIAGLVPISPVSVEKAGGSASANTLGRVTFTTVTSLSLNGVFTSTYHKYRIVMRGTVTGTDIELRFRMRAAGTDNSANSYLISYWVVRSNGTTGAPSGTATSGSIGQVSSTAMGGQFTSFVDLNNPSDASRPQLSFNGSGGNSTFAQNNVGGATLNVTSAFDGITIFPASGSMTGTIQVFGYNE